MKKCAIILLLTIFPLFAQEASERVQRDFKYSDLVLKMYVSWWNVPQYWFDSGTWQVEPNYYMSGGNNEVVSRGQFNVIRRVHYYMYVGDNPLNRHYWQKEDTELSKQFCFYRFTGKTILPEVDVYLFALDTKTGLLFSYALPGRFENVWGYNIPRDWICLDDHDWVKEHFTHKKFYQFDPIGYVNEENKVILYEWFTQQGSKRAGDINNYIPHMDDYTTVAGVNPGYSPYR